MRKSLLTLLIAHDTTIVEHIHIANYLAVGYSLRWGLTGMVRGVVEKENGLVLTACACAPLQYLM